MCDDSLCIDRRFRCDGKRDCPYDDSDERMCPLCPEDSFTCRDGRCILQDQFCDGIQDCNDGTDEPDYCAPSTRNCTTEEFRCNDGTCISSDSRCDAVINCVDASDELNCRKCTIFKVNSESSAVAYFSSLSSSSLNLIPAPSA
ncbi:hypothetical protein SK128_028349 [Halocaridina rubra]|uniref:Uncharacterized protein n=1 Tax=Halocaridina rubra TaxID=373956 RepID=A0AAN9A5Y2_HALRR